MFIIKIFKIFFNVLLLNTFGVFSFKINNLKMIDKNFNFKNLHNDMKKTSLLSKLIYDYDFVHKHDKKNDYLLDRSKSKDLTADFIKKNNIYLNLIQYVTLLDHKDFIKNSEKYFNLLNEYYPETEIYGYFYNKSRLHSLILINHKYQEIIVVFRGSQFFDEWITNFKINEKDIPFKDNLRFHSGILDMYCKNKIDNNIIFILNNLFDLFPKYRKIFTGHSRGSSQCLLLSVELISVLEQKYDYELFCYGNPQILNKDFSNFFLNNKNIIIHNIINDDDIISIVPLKNKYQFGNEIILKENNNITFIKHDKPYQLHNKFKINKLFKSISNHNLDKYIYNIFHNEFNDK